MKPTVLVVDDSEIVLAVARSLLEGAGYQVVTHGRATGCVSLILQLKPDLVLLDVNMPTLKGDAVVKMFERTSQVGGTTVLLHSTLAEAELERLVAASGAHGYIRKTDNAYSFLRQIQRYLGGRAPASESKIKASAVEERPGAPASEAFAPPTSRKMTRQLGAVLLADPDMLALAELRNLVQGAGFSTDFALSTTQALSKILSSQPPLVVIADLNLADPGVGHLYDKALERDASWAERFLITADERSARSPPRSFSGPVLKKPVAEAALRAALRGFSPRQVGVG